MLLNGSEFRALTLKAKEEGWAIGAFNAFDIPSAAIILDAAQISGKPLIIQVVDFNCPDYKKYPFYKETWEVEQLYAYIKYRAEHMRAPIAIHLDHCASFEGCCRAIKYGACSVMLDASNDPFEVNVERTLKNKEVCDATDTVLEAEIGHVKAVYEDDNIHSIYTTVEEAKAFYDATKVDMLAVSIGTTHGVYKDKPNLNYDRINELKNALDCVLVMHGSSGLDKEQFEKSIEAGITKINFSTYLQIKEVEGIKKALENPKSQFMNLNKGARDAGVEYILEHLDIFKTIKY